MVPIKRKLITFVQILLAGMIMFSLVQIYSYQQNLKQTDSIEAESRELAQGMRDNIAEASQNDAGDLEKDIVGISIDFIKELKTGFPEAIGHIEIDDTRISYPIVQHKDNDFYLNHSPDQSPNANGSIFLDHRNNELFNDDNNIVYGHYIKSGKLFHNLYKFREQEFYDVVDKIELQTLEGPKTYKVFSVYDTDPSFQYRYVNYPDKSEKMDFIDEVIGKSLINAGEIEELGGDDVKILTLSTCSNKGSTRLVVHGVEISE